jgi:hypothetical protein
MQGNSAKQRLALSIDSWNFLEDVSPVSHKGEISDPISEELENVKLKRALASEAQKRSEISSRLANLGTRAARFVEAVHALEEISDQLGRTRETLRKVGELAMEFPGPARSEIVSLCASVGVSVGPCIQVAGWQGLPRVRVFEEDLEISLHLCSEDGVSRATATHRGKIFDQSEISLPIAVLPGDATACMFRISDDASNAEIAHTHKVDVDQLFADGLPISVPLLKNQLPLNEAALVLRPQGISDHDFLVKIRDLEIAQHVDPDALVLVVYLGDKELKKFPLNRMNPKDIGKVKEGSQLVFRLFQNSDIFAAGSVLVLRQNSDCPLKDHLGNLNALVVLDVRDLRKLT